MAHERANEEDPSWSYRWGIFPSTGQQYLNWRHRQCRPYIRGKDLLDVPSGEGLGIPYFREAKSITCLDYDREAVERAKQRGANVVKAVCASMVKMPLADGSFDVVVSLEGLEHIDKVDGVAFLSEVARVLRPDGEFLLSCPVSIGGKHSGNEFHRHEWSPDELRDVLSIGFNIVAFQRHSTFNEVIWCRARRVAGVNRETWNSAWRSHSEGVVKRAWQGAASWNARVTTESGAPLHVDGSPSLLPTCFAVLAAESTGHLPTETLPREALAQTIWAQQDPNTGLFRPGALHRKDLSSHSATYIRLQATYFALHALDALDARPRYPVEFAEQLCDPSYLRGWLDGGPWQNPWLHSNNVMFALTLLERRAALWGDADALEAFDAILDYLDERQDPASGLWQPDDGPDVVNAVYAAYHFFPYYFWRGRRPAYVNEIIDSTLSIQQPDGLFTRGGGACEDLDGVHTLVMMSLITDHRADEVQRSLERCFWRLLQMQNPDGGFWNYPARARKPKRWKRKLAEQTGLIRLLPNRLQQRGEARPAEWHYSGWKVLSCPCGASDTWGTWFRPLALKLIAERYPETLPAVGTGTYRRIPGLGWHDAARISALGTSGPLAGASEQCGAARVPLGSDA